MSKRCDHGRSEGRDDSWWEYDARGIPLAKVCDRCKADKLAGYRPEVLTDANYECDEDVEPEATVGHDEGMGQGGDGYVDMMFGDSPDH